MGIREEVLPSFLVTPKKTFFGLDKNKAHCFTIPVSAERKFIEFFSLGEGFLQRDVSLIIGEGEYPAIVRMVRINRSKPYKLSPESLQIRNKVQFDWRKEKVTQAVMRIELLRSFDQISSGKKNTTQKVLFSHVRDGVFRLRIEETD